MRWFGSALGPARRCADVAVDNLTRWDFTKKAGFTSHPRSTFAASAATLEHPHSLGIIRKLTRLLPVIR
jgi:hypothetical protein